MSDNPYRIAPPPETNDDAPVPPGGVPAPLETNDDAPAPPVQKGLALNADQMRAVKYVLDGFRMFFTGAGGTGKSTTLRHIINILPRDTTAVVSWTGIAAVPLGGCTICKWGGIGLGNGTVDEIVGRMRPAAKSRWRTVQVLIIDEISMLSGDMFDKLEAIARRVRCDERPFGGIQVVACGDFYQCPPVNKKHAAEDPDVVQCFEARTWSTVIEIEYALRTVMRQKEPLAVEFVTALRDSNTDEVGRVQLDDKWVQLMNILRRPLPKRRDGIQPTRLRCTNDDVDFENTIELNKLPGKEHVYRAVDSGQPEYIQFIDKHCIARPELRLKVGAQVMLIKNNPSNPNLVNGSRGIVTGFEMPEDDPGCPAPLPIVKFRTGETEMIHFEEWTIEDRGAKPLARRVQVALILAWSMTVHKSQGMTLDWVEVDISNAFGYGLAYTALTRFVTLGGLSIRAYNLQRIRNNPKVRRFMRELHKRPENQHAE